MMSGAKASFTPFTGKVRMGQDDPRVAELRQKVQATAMRDDVRAAALEKLAECQAKLTAGDNAGFEKCAEELRYVLNSPLLPMLSTREESDRAMAEFNRKLEEERMSTTAWISLAAVAAGIGWLVYKG